MAKFGDIRLTNKDSIIEKERVKTSHSEINSHRPLTEFKANLSKTQVREPSPSGVPPYSDRSSKQPE